MEPEPLPQREDATPRIFAFVDDLFFLAKIQETARKLNVKVEFVKTEKDLLEHLKQNGEEKPSLIIFDLNNANAKPLVLIPKLKTKLKKGTSIIGFLSHVQGDLKQKAHEVGCDMVLPRSAFSQNLPQLLRRHGAPEDEAAV
ncbi:MAG: response regulator [Acidobacteriia bacterium]|nr:response regulator [Terriglobia bacterium]